jgi:hypothetical protein
MDSISDLSFEEGLICIGAWAFAACDGIRGVVFPASLEVIGMSAFRGCVSLRSVSFAVGSRLRCIRGEAFLACPLDRVALPAGIREIDPSALDSWLSVAWNGPRLLLANDRFVFSADSRILLRSFSQDRCIVILRQLR